MLMMTVPESFKWVETDTEELNSMSLSQKKAFLKKEEIKIRQSLGEAVPTVIFREIAKKMKSALKTTPLNNAQINKIVSTYNFSSTKELIEFIDQNPLKLSFSSLSRIAEMSNTKRTDNAAFFTSKPLITEIMKNLPECTGSTVTILEPSVGVGNFLPLIIQKFSDKEIYLDCVDIDEDSIEVAKALMKKYQIPPNCHIRFIADDFLLHDFEKKYDYVIGNPPFYKMSADSRINEYKKNAINKTTNNICSFFLDKSMMIGNYVALVFPKFLLNTPEFAESRKYLESHSIHKI